MYAPIILYANVAFEFALVELENEADAKAVADIFQARIDYQIENTFNYNLAISSSRASTSPSWGTFRSISPLRNRSPSPIPPA